MVVDLDFGHPVESPERLRIGPAGEPKAHHPRRARPEVLHGVGHDQSAVTDDRDPVGDALDLGERVRRQQYRPASRRGLAHEALELCLHQGIEPRGRLVEDQQLGACAKASNKPTFCRLPFDNSPTGRSISTPNRVDQVVGHRCVVGASRATEPREVLRPGHSLEELQVAR